MSHKSDMKTFLREKVTLELQNKYKKAQKHHALAEQKRAEKVRVCKGAFKKKLATVKGVHTPDEHLMKARFKTNPFFAIIANK